VALLVSLLASGGCKEEGSIRVKSLTFEGVSQVDQGQLEQAMATKESSWLPWGKKRFFDRSRFDTDLKRIQAFYADRGFPDARVQSMDVQMNDAGDAVDIHISIDEGQPVVVERLELEGFDELPEEARERLRGSLAVKEGQPLDRAAYAAAREAIVNAFADQGYPYATVEPSSEPVGGGPKRVRVMYRATPGGMAVFGPIEIVGNASVDDTVIRRELEYRPGDLYRRSRLRESQRELYGLELFEFANIEPLTDSQPAQIPTRITVAEGKHRRVNFGAGYGTEEKLRGHAQWRHTNFFGDARTLGVHGRWSSLDRGARVNFTQPYLLEPHLSLTLSGQLWRTVQPIYQADVRGGRVTLTHRKGTGVMWAVSFVNEFQRSAVTDEALEDLGLRDELIALGLDPTDGTQGGTVIGVELDFQRNATDSLLDARRGYYAAIHVEQAGAWLPGSYDYYSITTDARYYVTLGGRAVVASRLQIGALDGIGAVRADEGPLARVPFAERFFLGGATSLRGWGRFEVSPLSGSGLPIGGRSMLEASAELRMPVWGKLGAVAFIDAGNVWSDVWQFELGDLRYAVGPGLRYLTPIGPVRFDVGYQLNPIDGLLVDGEPEKRRWRMHFSIGQAF
jgi:outer membrane protein assembly complex protein YaeT